MFLFTYITVFMYLFLLPYLWLIAVKAWKRKKVVLNLEIRVLRYWITVKLSKQVNSIWFLSIINEINWFSFYQLGEGTRAFLSVFLLLYVYYYNFLRTYAYTTKKFWCSYPTLLNKKNYVMWYIFCLSTQQRQKQRN